jgi:hypothetical protein
MSGWLYLIRRHDGLDVSLHETRHDAVYWQHRYHDANDYAIVPVNPLAIFDIDPRNPHR